MAGLVYTRTVWNTRVPVGVITPSPSPAVGKVWVTRTITSIQAGATGAFFRVRYGGGSYVIQRNPTTGLDNGVYDIRIRLDPGQVLNVDCAVSTVDFTLTVYEFTTA